MAPHLFPVEKPSPGGWVVGDSYHDVHLGASIVEFVILGQNAPSGVCALTDVHYQIHIPDDGGPVTYWRLGRGSK